MTFPDVRSWGLALVAMIAVTASGAPSSTALAQAAGEQKAAEQQKPPAGEPGKEGQKTIAEFAEAARLLGGPAANPECVWLGRRVVSLMWRDDLDTAFRHLDLYDRFGCPGGHVQATFRCLVRQGNLDPKSAADTLNGRVHACWVNPTLQAAAAASASPGAPASAAAPTGQAADGQAAGTTPR